MLRARVKPRTLILSSLLAAGCLSAFAVWGWDVQVSLLFKALVIIFLVFLSISIPAAALLALIKLSAFAAEKIREKE